MFIGEMLVPEIIFLTICLDVTLGVEMLLEAGADTKIKDSNKKTALDHAVARGLLMLYSYKMQTPNLIWTQF